MGYEIVIPMSVHPSARFRLRLAGSLLLACLATVGSSVSAQSTSPPVSILQLNQPVTANLKDGELHTYKLNAEAGMLVTVFEPSREPADSGRLSNQTQPKDRRQD